MNFYHFSDKPYAVGHIFKSLSFDGTYSFFADELSLYGLYVVNKQFSSDTVPFCYFKEFLFEWVRQKEFPNCVSRLSCVYGLRSLDDARYWEPYRLKNSFLYEVSADSYSFVDAGWYDHSERHTVSLLSSARSYWSGTKNDLYHCPEVLMALPVTIAFEHQDYKSATMD